MRKYFKSVAGIGVIAMATSDAGLVSHQGGHLFEFFAVYVAVSVQVKHAKGNFKVAPGSCGDGKKRRIRLRNAY